MSTTAAIQSMQYQAARAPTANFAQRQGAFNNERQMAASAPPKAVVDKVAISPEAFARMSSVAQVHVDTRVLANDSASSRISIMA